MTPRKTAAKETTSLLDDHVSPRILAAEVRRSRLRWAAYLGQNKKKCFTDSISIPHSQKGDEQHLLLNRYSLRQEKPSLRRV